MKTKFFITLVALVFSSSVSFAQNRSTSKITKRDWISSRGFRVSALKPMLDAEIKASYGLYSNSVIAKLDNVNGLALGYANLPVEELGWTSNFAYFDVKNNNSSGGLARLDGNVAYTFSQKLNVKGGLNISRITSGTNLSTISPGFGLQGGLGYQVTKNFGIDIGYTQMNQTGSYYGVKFDIKYSGLEIGLNGTF